MRIRPYKSFDLEKIIDFATRTKAFKPSEVDILREVLEGHPDDPNYVCMVAEDNEKAVGVCYYAFQSITESVWYLWWIVVDSAYHGRGIAKELVSFMEKDVVYRKGKSLLIETGSSEPMTAARKFYEKSGYEKHAVVKKYYSDVEDLVIYRKEL